MCASACQFALCRALMGCRHRICSRAAWVHLWNRASDNHCNASPRWPGGGRRVNGRHRGGRQDGQRARLHHGLPPRLPHHGHRQVRRCWCRGQHTWHCHVLLRCDPGGAASAPADPCAMPLRWAVVAVHPGAVAQQTQPCWWNPDHDALHSMCHHPTRPSGLVAQ
jgi:hypothetical protein